MLASSNHIEGEIVNENSEVFRGLSGGDGGDPAKSHYFFDQRLVYTNKNVINIIACQ